MADSTDFSTAAESAVRMASYWQAALTADKSVATMIALKESKKGVPKAAWKVEKKAALKVDAEEVARTVALMAVKMVSQRAWRLAVWTVELMAASKVAQTDG